MVSEKIPGVILLTLALVLAMPISIAENATMPDLNSHKDVLNILDPGDLGVSEISSNSVAISQVGTVATYNHNSSIAALNNAVQQLNGSVYNRTRELLTQVGQGKKEGFNVERNLWVYEAVPTYVNVEGTFYVTKKTITFTAPRNVSNVEIVEIVSPEVISNFSHVNFKGQKPTVFHDKPPFLMKWTFPNLTKGESVNITYHTKGLIVGNEGRGGNNLPTFLFATGKGLNKTKTAEEPSEITGMVAAGNNSNAVITSAEDFSKKSIVEKIVFISVIVALFFLLTIFVIEMDDKGAFRGVKNCCRDLEAYARIGFNNKHMVDQYIKDCLDKGYHWEDVRISLVRAGWSRTAIRRLINKYK